MASKGGNLQTGGSDSFHQGGIRSIKGNNLSIRFDNIGLFSSGSGPAAG